MKDSYWINTHEYGENNMLKYKCARCRSESDVKFDYCPYCGANMDGNGGIPRLVMLDVELKQIDRMLCLSFDLKDKCKEWYEHEIECEKRRLSND